jgi:hypothetical protein
MRCKAACAAMKLSAQREEKGEGARTTGPPPSALLLLVLTMEEVGLARAVCAHYITGQ